ncbi:GNAT family N-acetyltransferase [Heyndrickxia camelliae]|uniref:GNAT family N-acetyltransferase n=1 Tax=Heyndrickxia camelliae TaxID=1707093 RepID=A0A2N3LGR9_9BACI|nr:GNAT family N-acetyltransferase [Heyndrickxia camelliae]PKR83755.1 GNAT family N-acetyltransferase [Heyndrickxia camelliae]
MIALLKIDNQKIAEEILHVQLPAYGVEANLMNFHDIPPLHDTVDSILGSEETFYGYWKEGKLAGVISVEENKQHLQICRLVVHPAYFRQGIGKQLVQFIFETYKHIHRFVVSTGEQNVPAIKLYGTFGFKEFNKIEISANIFIICLEKIYS